MFLTLEDPNAKIKGSRDPLGAQPIWALFARHVVTNLTTVSNSVRGFTILLLARYLCARLIEENAVTRDDALNVFLKVEQIGSYARHVGHGVEGDIRGIERVKKFLEEGRGKVTIAADHRGFILGDQKVYGLWGLYSVSARVSGLIPEGPVGVEPTVGEFIERNYLPRLQPAMSQIMRLLSKGGRLDTKRKDPVFQAFADILAKGFTSQEIDFYGRYLRDGLEVDTPHKGRQANLHKLLEDHADLQQPVGRDELTELIKRARPVDSALADRLERIVTLEAVLAPADALFQHALTQTGQQPSSVAKHVKAQWGASVPNIDPAAFEQLLVEVSEASSKEIAADIHRCAVAMASGNYEVALRAVLDWNAKVMAERKAGPWALVAENGIIDVRYRGAEQQLPSGESLATLWRNNYFIDSLKSVTRQLRIAA